LTARDPRQAAIERAVRAATRAIIADMERRVAPSIVEARGVERLMLLFETDERPAERIRRENALALGEMAALGNTRGAAAQVARRWSSDPHTREMLAQRFRRLRRRGGTKNKRALFV
jgi:hypothetical protein